MSDSDEKPPSSGYLDRVPGPLDLYIGGLFALRRKQSLQASKITHVLSVLRGTLDKTLFEKFTHKQVEVDDVDDENLLEHFPACNRFIQDGLDAGGGVLIHCAMGKSRSATVLCAFLMYHHRISFAEALALVRESRPFCDPNSGFVQQLELYHSMGMPENIDEEPAYQRWLYQREIELSRACNQAPDADKIRFEDEHSNGTSANPTAFELRCRKCRRPLATSQYLVSHKPKHAEGGAMQSTSTSSPSCSHYFLDPLSWMRPQLEQGMLGGRLECPKCKTNVGKYAWQGMQCSCGDWVVPGISLAKGRIDEGRSRASSGAATAAAGGIRHPPTLGTDVNAVRKSHENL